LFPVELNLVETRLAGVRRITGILRDIAERKQADAHIAHLAYYDNLTDLPGRALFYDRLKQSITHARRDQHELALLYIDLDRFKAVNDTLGHDAGDELLKMVAARLKACVRESDTAARLGGDEFVVILPKVDGCDNVIAVADKIVDAISSKFVLAPTNREVVIGVSIGIAMYPQDAEDSEELVRAADSAMYAAKLIGGCYRFHKSDATKAQRIPGAA